MGRTVTAVVTHDGVGAGAVGPFAVDSPWWAEVEPVVAHLEAALGGPAIVLRLLATEGGEGGNGGHVTYHAEALDPPGELPPCDFAGDDHPLRMPWARVAGVRDLLGWAAGQVSLSGPPVQRKTWNLACLFRLPTPGGTVWLKAIPGFAAAEPAAIAAVAAVDPGLVPAVLATGPGRMLLADVPGSTAGTRRRRSSPRRSAVWRPRRRASSHGRPRFPTGGRTCWRRRSATCSTDRSAPS